VSLVPKDTLSTAGDSGSILIDKQFRPVAMLWGGEIRDFAIGPEDVTYGSPLVDVFKDIENFLGGTVSLL
jgi:hypothetical protein